jgi:hypothetical protein
VRSWRGDNVTVTATGWYFHHCLCCGRPICNQTGYGPTCAKGPLTKVERDVWRRRALAADRKHYRAEVLDLGFVIE